MRICEINVLSQVTAAMVYLSGLRLLRIATSSWPKTVTIHGRSLLARSRPDQQTCLRLQAWQDQCQATAARSIQNSRQYIALVVQDRLSLQGDNKFCQQSGINSG